MATGAGFVQVALNSEQAPREGTDRAVAAGAARFRRGVYPATGLETAANAGSNQIASEDPMKVSRDKNLSWTCDRRCPPDPQRYVPAAPAEMESGRTRVLSCPDGRRPGGQCGCPRDQPQQAAGVVVEDLGRGIEYATAIRPDSPSISRGLRPNPGEWDADPRGQRKKTTAFGPTGRPTCDVLLRLLLRAF